jgi:class 3 adenylate cyclase
MNKDVESLPLGDIESEDAKVLIDLYSLGAKKMKTCRAGIVFVDMDGYTALIDSLLGDEKKLADAVKLLHLFRYELQRVAEADFNGISIQHQGDRMLAIVHLPSDDDDAVRNKLAEICVSLNSSVESVLNVDFKIFSDPYHVSIGAAHGKTVVVRSGAKGDLDASCLGTAVLNAEAFQVKTRGNDMRIAKDVFAAIKNDALRKLFIFDKDLDCYVGSEITWKKVEDKAAALAYAAKALVGFDAATKKITFNPAPNSSSVPVKNTSNWGE